MNLTERMITQAYNPEKHYAVSEANKFANFLQTYIYIHIDISPLQIYFIYLACFTKISTVRALQKLWLLSELLQINI